MLHGSCGRDCVLHTSQTPQALIDLFSRFQHFKLFYQMTSGQTSRTDL